MILLLALLSSHGLGCKQSNNEAPRGDASMKIKLSSMGFVEGETIPKQYAGDGKDISPALHWSDPPPGTNSFALICEDPDAPRGTWVHWVLFNLPGDQRELAEALPAQEVFASGAKHGKNDFGNLGYGGPAPPPGKPHRYYFKLYALDTMLDLAPSATRKKLISAMEAHVLAEGQLMGHYGR
jgi:Raf kinase inhibitor-like YbhB/YbcL family protein